MFSHKIIKATGKILNQYPGAPSSPSWDEKVDTMVLINSVNDEE